MKNSLFDLRKGITNPQTLGLVNNTAIEILAVKIQLISDGNKLEKEKLINLLQNFIKEVGKEKHFDHFLKMKESEQIKALTDTAFLIINK